MGITDGKGKAANYNEKNGPVPCFARCLPLHRFPETTPYNPQTA